MASVYNHTAREQQQGRQPYQAGGPRDPGRDAQPAAKKEIMRRPPGVVRGGLASVRLLAITSASAFVRLSGLFPLPWPQKICHRLTLQPNAPEWL